MSHSRIQNEDNVNLWIVYEGELDQNNIIKVIHTNEDDLNQYCVHLKRSNPNGDFRYVKIAINPFVYQSVRSV